MACDFHTGNYVETLIVDYVGVRQRVVQHEHRFIVIILC